MLITPSAPPSSGKSPRGMMQRVWELATSHTKAALLLRQVLARLEMPAPAASNLELETEPPQVPQAPELLKCGRTAMCAVAQYLHITQAWQLRLRRPCRELCCCHLRGSTAERSALGSSMTPGSGS